jgi:hypothetical protein
MSIMPFSFFLFPFYFSIFIFFPILFSFSFLFFPTHLILIFSSPNFHLSLIPIHHRSRLLALAHHPRPPSISLTGGPSSSTRPPVPPPSATTPTAHPRPSSSPATPARSRSSTTYGGAPAPGLGRWIHTWRRSSRSRRPTTSSGPPPPCARARGAPEPPVPGLQLRRQSMGTTAHGDDGSPRQQDVVPLLPAPRNRRAPMGPTGGRAGQRGGASGFAASLRSNCS